MRQSETRLGCVVRGQVWALQSRRKTCSSALIYSPEASHASLEKARYAEVFLWHSGAVVTRALAVSLLGHPTTQLQCLSFGGEAATVSGGSRPGMRVSLESRSSGQPGEDFVSFSIPRPFRHVVLPAKNSLRTALRRCLSSLSPKTSPSHPFRSERDSSRSPPHCLSLGYFAL